MRNNELPLLRHNGNDKNIVRARNKLIRLYNEFRQSGGWRAVAKARGSKNQQYIYNFAMHGIEPTNPVERRACFLPDRVCETCKRTIRENKPHVHKEMPEWMKQWRALPKEKREELIRGFMEKVTGA
jgi:hypothetical protein